MKYFQDEGSMVIKSWCNNPEEGAISQAKNLARLPRLFESFGETFLIILLLVCIIIESWFVVIILKENWRWAGRLARGKK